jgi:hypothetical protein
LSLPDRSAERSEKSHNPGHATPAGLTHDWFGLFRFRSPLLTESRLLSLPVGNEMFHFPTFPPLALCVQARVTGHDSSRVSPFGHPRITARLAAPRGLSQPPTSFIGSWCQGIHRAPLLAWPQRCSRPLCSSQGAGGPDRASRRQASSALSPEGSCGTTNDPVLSVEKRRVGRDRPAPSGLSERLRSLRTQQRARLGRPAPASFPGPRTCTRKPARDTRAE